ncbi:MAG: DNA polymerase III subunit beta [Candidatus Eisenbacteria bacterium]|nr:DNA polymerase III subunit beta [Candidatus Eisenbacteria bacterium]
MDFSVVQSELLRTLQLVVSVVPAKSVLQNVHSSVLVRSTEDGRVRLEGTDADQYMTAELRATVEAPGTVAVQGRRFLEIVKELPPGTVRLRLKGSSLEVSSGQGKFRLVTRSAEDFPAFPEVEDSNSVEVPAREVERLARSTAYAVSTDDSRTELSGVLVEVVGQEIRFVGTDGHRLSRAMYPVASSKDWKFLVPPRTLNTLQRLISEGESNVRISADATHVRIEVGANQLSARLLRGEYPNYERVIPTGNDKIAVVKTETLLAAVRRVGIFSDSFTRRVTLSLEPGSLRVSVQTQDVGEAEEHLEARYDGEPMRISYNAGYLTEMLRTIESEELQMAFKGPMQAGLFRPEGEGSASLLCLVMPLRLPDEEPLAAPQPEREGSRATS